MSDIVQRLRTATGAQIGPTMLEAADEIEHLRARVKLWEPSSQSVSVTISEFRAIDPCTGRDLGPSD